MHPHDLEYLLLYLIPRIRNSGKFTTAREWRDFLSDLETAVNIVRAEIDAIERNRDPRD